VLVDKTLYLLIGEREEGGVGVVIDGIRYGCLSVRVVGDCE